MLEVSCRLVVAEFGLKTVRLVAAFSFRICIVVKFRIVETVVLAIICSLVTFFVSICNTVSIIFLFVSLMCA